ncbi:hypothetical protein DCCM_2360 [Desulfocucumis palustris]|uniref:Uncharacterized protein n=2 Tax=Desulfocucumis palustris TaxID=1898651 RepID=A0A2L2XHA8_9FIRM|nr:hypothetical protein DCCM_2360 [Desulfocucumis palustris]
MVISTQDSLHLELVSSKGAKYKLIPASEFITGENSVGMLTGMFSQFPVNKNIAQIKVSGYLLHNDTIQVKSMTINKICI